MYSDSRSLITFATKNPRDSLVLSVCLQQKISINFTIDHARAIAQNKHKDKVLFKDIFHVSNPRGPFDQFGLFLDLSPLVFKSKIDVS